MSTGSYEKSNWAWQFQQWQKQVGEWWELQLSRFSPDFPGGSGWSLPAWLSSPVLFFIARVIFWVLIALLVCWIALQLMRRFSPYVYSWRNQLDQQSEKLTTTPDRTLSVADWLARSQNCQTQGDYREACLYLYRAMLQQLHDSGQVTQQPSRTDGEYLHLVQQFPQSRAYQRLLITHQQLCFSQTPASRSLFEECQQAYQQINQG
jgi:hypothetical protein